MYNCIKAIQIGVLVIVANPLVQLAEGVSTAEMKTDGAVCLSLLLRL